MHLFLSSSVPAVVPGEQHGLHARAWLSAGFTAASKHLTLLGNDTVLSFRS